MSEFRKWLKIMETVPPTIADQPAKNVNVEKNATVMIDPTYGGGTGRFIRDTAQGAMIEIKGVIRELKFGDFSLPNRDYEDPYTNSNSWTHKSVVPDTIGTMNNAPELRAGDMVKIEDVFGSVIGPGFGIFIAYSTSGLDCIISFDNREIVVPTANVSSIQEQAAKERFSQTDNDGNLSPMSLGSQNVKIEKEPEMDHRDEFSKWISTVEEALSNEGGDIGASMPAAPECGCGSWDCATCFPAQNNDTDGPEAAIVIGGVDMAEPGMHSACPTCGHEDHEHDAMQCDLDSGMQDIGADEYSGLEEVGMEEDDEDGFEIPFAAVPNKVMPLKGGNMPVEEEEMEFEQPEKGRSGKGVKLGDIVTKTEFRKSGGENSPMTYGEDNLDEDEYDGFGDYEDGDRPEDDGMYANDTQRNGGMDMGDDDDSEFEGDEDDELTYMISTIAYMQEMGISNSNKLYNEDELRSMSPEQLQQIHSQVTGDISEAFEPAPKPTKTKMYDPLDDLDDVLNPRPTYLPADVDTDGNIAAGDSPMHLPSASRADTQNQLRGMNPSQTMRDLMNRISPYAGAGEGELANTTPDTPQNELMIRTARDVPSVISQAMQASGMQTPDWHNVNNLPGFGDRNIRGMGRQVFGMFTNTPVEQIQTMANVDGQGPNTEAEMRAVAGWLRDNAEDMGSVDVSHGMAIPGYKPDVKEFKANGIRFHVVRDQAGQYIYAYPDKDAKSFGSGNAQLGRPGPGNMPRLRESSILSVLKPTLFEQIKWDEEINAILRETALDEEEIEESTLSQKVGKLPNGKRNEGGQNLVKFLHGKHKLGNESELRQLPFNKNVLWTEFKSNPDNFVIVQGTDGVAGIKPSQAYIDHMTTRYAEKRKTYNPSGDSNLKYQVVAFKNDGAKLDSSLFQAPEKEVKTPKNPDDQFTTQDPTVIRTRMGMAHGKDTQVPYNVFNLLAEEIGTLKYVWVSGFWGIRGDKGEPQDIEASTGSVERDKMAKRADMKKVPAFNQADAVSKILTRVRPVLKTLANQALGQINNRAKRYIDGGNFEAATKIAQSGGKLKQLLATIDTSGPLAGEGAYALKQQLRNALIQASGSQSYTPEFEEFLRSAAEGNSAALKPVLDALRDSLVALT
jgi:hypothetical protein